MSTPVFRFAPSSNGFLHLGHAFSALVNFDMAKAVGGRFLLRIEDIDVSRCRPEFETAIYEDLDWLGISWERPVRRQSDHLDDYRVALARLEAQGLLYPSFESRAEIARLVAAREAEEPWPRDPDGMPLYPGNAKAMIAAERARLLQSGAPYALRLDTQAASECVGVIAWNEQGSGAGGESGTIVAKPQAWGDVVLARKDVPTSYHLSVVVDDAAQGVTHVVRGQDLFWATSMHRLLQQTLAFPEPRYRHHELIRDARGAKLAKSTRATGLRELRAQGVTPGDIRRMVGLA